MTMHTILALLFHTLIWLNLIIHITPAQTGSILLVETLSAVMCHSSLHFFYKSPTHSQVFSSPSFIYSSLLSLSRSTCLLACIAAVDTFSNWLCVRSYLTQSVGYLSVFVLTTLILVSFTLYLVLFHSYFFTCEGHYLYYLSLRLLSSIDVCSCTFD